MSKENEAIQDLKNLIVDVEFIEDETDIDNVIKEIKKIIGKLEGTEPIYE